MAAGSFTTDITLTGSGLSVERLYQAAGLTLPSTPGRVGVCLSGGGSRALTAGMGQLRALKQLTVNGAPVLGQVRALSTVSGGSWLGVPFTFLPSTAASDDAYLGPYVAEQSKLTPAELAVLPAGNAGTPITSDSFSVAMLALEALILYEVLGVTPNMLWQTLIALHILAAHGLSSMSAKLMPDDTFTLNAATQAASVTNSAANPPLNPTIANEIIDHFAAATGRVTRPYLICNTAMFLDQTGVLPLAPVQTGGLITGILGAPSGVDGNGLPVGGGAVTSFAFNSLFAGAIATTATIAQTRQWSLTDAVGASSAAIAYALQNQIAIWEQNPLEFAAEIVEYFDELLQWIRSHLPLQQQAEARAMIQRYATSTGPSDLSALKFSFPNLQDLIPQYYYWSPSHQKVVQQPAPTRFADGGSLENTGINGMLAYSDIDSVISFVNTEAPIQSGDFGVSDGHGGFIPNTQIVIDESIPPLFGYKPYEAGGLGQYQGYVPYADTTNNDFSAYAQNQVFPSDQFPALLQGLAAAAGAGFTRNSAIFTQSLSVMCNTWFGITGGKTVKVVWCYLNFAQSWADLFANNPDVAALVTAARTSNNFPHYNTLDTSLTATEVNLLSNYSCWAVTNQAATFADLFAGPGV
ncbi:hypothetical protein [Methylocapsa aurea]|uniref:hypothetical protein n=1 Tax=Methylocapsa aurea TaxID=663610 RepID=UPI0012EC11DB|nr:hypothetical protein [Methylocapsa aurea]